MTKIDDGGPAFPTSLSAEGPFGGMTLRDWFAGHALAGWLATYSPRISHPADREGSPELLAKDAYTLADAMIEARKRHATGSN